MFNFTVFKSVMEVSDIDEVAYAFILRAVLLYIKNTFNIDIDRYTEDSTPTITGTAQIDSIVSVSISTQILTTTSLDGTWSITTSTLLNGTYLATITETPLVGLPVVTTRYIGIDSNTAVPIDLQYAIFQHAKYLFDYQKKSISTIDAIVDTNGNKVTYKAIPPISSLYVYKEYSIDPIAFI